MQIKLTVSILHLFSSLLYLFSDSEAFEHSPTKDLSKTGIKSGSLVKNSKQQPGDEDIRTEEIEAKTSKDLNNNLTEDKDMEVMDARDEGAQTNGKCQVLWQIFCFHPCSRIRKVRNDFILICVVNTLNSVHLSNV